MKGVALILMLVLVSSQARAADPSCIQIADRDLRLNCYDKANGYVNPGKAKQVAPLPAIRWQVRNDGRFDSYAGSDLGSKNGEVSVQHRDGQDYVLANVAVLAAFTPLNDQGFQPFASARWQRSETRTKRSDIRELSLGLAMPLGDPFGPHGVGLFLTPRYIYRTDIFGETDSHLLTVHGNIVKRSWTSAPEGDMKANLLAFVPNFGLIYDHRDRPGLDWGTWTSGYVGFEFSGQWNKITPRLQSTLKYQYFSDFSQPDGVAARSDDYVLASVSYEFTDPEDTSVKVRPAVFLSREVGLNPVLSADRFNLTTFGFGLKVNSY